MSRVAPVVLSESAPAKVNLVLRVAAPRADGMHPLLSLFASLQLADTLRFQVGAPADEVVCAGLDGEENLAARALAELRRRVPEAELPPLRIAIDKRIPVAAGLGGGSADAAAVLRVCGRLLGAAVRPALLREAALAVGADVPSQVEPRHALVGGIGEEVEPIALPALALVLVPRREGLPTAAVYRELDRLGKYTHGLDRQPLRALAAGPVPQLARALTNDLEPAALSLRPELAEGLDELRALGALGAGITGSGPTAFAIFANRAAAEEAAARIDGAIVTETRSP